MNTTNHKMQIPFNKPYLTGKEAHYIYQSVFSGHISGNGLFTKKCHSFFEKRYGFKKVLLTTSCTDALEMAALLLNIQPGDEVITPSYTFVSTPLAFVRQGATILFADSESITPNMDANKIESLITEKTRAIVPVHYAGIACEMDKIMKLAEKYNLFVVEDAAHSIDSYYKGIPLGTIGHLSAFSFHETKNINAGEGGMLGINDEQFIKRAEIIWEKGTNRSQFFRGEVEKYSWIDTGSSFLPSDIIAAYLYAQLENIESIQNRRKAIWQIYHEGFIDFEEQGYLQLPKISRATTNNAHMFFMICNTPEERDELLKHLKSKGIKAVFHYLSLHKSPYFTGRYEGEELPNSDRFSDCLLRLPLFFELTDEQTAYIIREVRNFFSKQ